MTRLRRILVVVGRSVSKLAASPKLKIPSSFTHERRIFTSGHSDSSDNLCKFCNHRRALQGDDQAEFARMQLPFRRARQAHAATSVRLLRPDASDDWITFSHCFRAYILIQVADVLRTKALLFDG